MKPCCLKGVGLARRLYHRGPVSLSRVVVQMVFYRWPRRLRFALPGKNIHTHTHTHTHTLCSPTTGQKGREQSKCHPTLGTFFLDVLLCCAVLCCAMLCDGSVEQAQVRPRRVRANGHAWLHPPPVVRKALRSKGEDMRRCSTAGGRGGGRCTHVSHRFLSSICRPGPSPTSHANRNSPVEMEGAHLFRRGGVKQ